MLFNIHEVFMKIQFYLIILDNILSLYAYNKNSIAVIADQKYKTCR